MIEQWELWLKLDDGTRRMRRWTGYAYEYVDVKPLRPNVRL
jgi:hypothetical protein